MKHDIELAATSPPISELPYATPVQVLLIDGSSHDLPLLCNASKWDSLEPFEIMRKRSLAEGLAEMQNALFRIVLLDISVSTLPNMESVTDVVQAAKGLPVIALINEGGVTKAAEAMRLGAQIYALKGCDSDALLNTLKHMMERQNLIAAIEDGKESIARESHELRNALACIHQFSSILLDGLAGPISDEQREYVGIILQNASRVRAVVESLKDYVPYDNGEFMKQTDLRTSMIGAN